MKFEWSHCTTFKGEINYFEVTVEDGEEVAFMCRGWVRPRTDAYGVTTFEARVSGNDPDPTFTSVRDAMRFVRHMVAIKAVAGEYSEVKRRRQ